MKIPMFKSTNLSAGFRGFSFKFGRNTPDYGAIALFFAGQALLVLATEEVRHRRELRKSDEVLSLDGADEPGAWAIEEDESPQRHTRT